MSFTWTEQNLKWFEQATAETDFYSKIVEQCSSIINNHTTFIDLGCGTGELAITLASCLESGLAIDINQLVISKLRDKCTRLNITNLTPVVGNWLNYDFTTSYDLVFLSYLNGLIANFNRLKLLADRFIIAILPQQTEKDPFGLGQFCRTTFPHRESINQAVQFLQANNIEFKLINHSREFGQPFSNLDQFKEFLQFYFNIQDQTTIDQIKTNYLQQTQSGFYLPQIKKSGILIIKCY